MFTKQMLSKFNELDFAIYNTIIRNGAHATELQIKELADEAHVSTASIVRFCKKCGCSGYAEFRLRYRESLVREKTEPAAPENRIVADFISYSATPDFTKNIDAAFQLLRSAGQIIVLGVGASGNLANFGARMFCNVGYFGLGITDPFLPVSNLTSTTPVVIAVSFSGNTKQTIEMADCFLECGCKLISVTNTYDCPLAKMSDVNIAYYVPDFPVNGRYNLGTEIPVVYVFERLARMLYEYREGLEA